jgi:drug/metabolite transporter (DMT)-like permease
MEPFRLFGWWTYAVSILGVNYESLIALSAVRVVPIVNVSIFINMSPLITVVLAICILGEMLTLISGSQALLSFIGVVCIVTGGQDLHVDND